MSTVLSTGCIATSHLPGMIPGSGMSSSRDAKRKALTIFIVLVLFWLCMLPEMRLLLQTFCLKTVLVIANPLYHKNRMFSSHADTKRRFESVEKDDKINTSCNYCRLYSLHNAKALKLLGCARVAQRSRRVANP